MHFALMYSYDPAVAAPSDGEVQAWLDLDTDLRAAGAHVHEAGYHSPAEARTVQVDASGKANVQDGPVTSDGPVVAGHYVIDVADEHAALQWAARIPTASYGTVEVRRVVQF